MNIYESSSKVFEAYYSNFTAGTFRQGDVVAFNDTKELQKSEQYKNLEKTLKDKLDTMIAAQQSGDAVIVVHEVGLNPLFRSNFEPSTISIGYGQGGGRILDIITIPGSLAAYMTLVKDLVNQVSTIPPNARHETAERTSLAELDVDKVNAHKNIGHVEGTIFADPEK